MAEHINDELGLTLDGNLDDLGLGEDCDEDGLGDLFDNWGMFYRNYSYWGAEQLIIGGSFSIQKI